jgi:hypothetical protein
LLEAENLEANRISTAGTLLTEGCRLSFLLKEGHMTDKKKQSTTPAPRREKLGRKGPGERGSQPDSHGLPNSAGRKSSAQQRPEDDEREVKRREMDKATDNWDEE